VTLVTNQDSDDAAQCTQRFVRKTAARSPSAIVRREYVNADDMSEDSNG
jgi:hypothetical protein